MRIENKMAGYRPPPPKPKSKDGTMLSGSTSLVHSGQTERTPSRSSDDLNEHDDHNEQSLRQKVHKRQKLVKAAYVLTTRGCI
jgi:hypothetical protein